MKKRIIAWVMLVGFLLLIINITFIGYQRLLSFLIYAVIALYYVFAFKKEKSGGQDGPT